MALLDRGRQACDGAPMRVEGGCHCGAVRFAAQLPGAVELLDCNCSICSLTGFLHLIVPHDEFELMRGADALTSYRFGTGAAEHLFCRTCGVKSFYQPRSHPNSWSINYRALEAPAGLRVTTRSFDGRNWEASAARLID
jgi:hypothetical protein